jgi:hypothetical protein
VRALKGIDISSWQAGLDIDKLGIDFAILKISEGQSWVDPQFDTFYTQATVPVGAYVYSHATTIQAAEQEAQKALSLLRGRPCPLGVYMDVEAAEQLMLSDNQLTDVVRAFCNIIKSGGYIAGVYGSEGNLWAKVRPSALDGDTLIWVAKWSSMRPSMPCDIWQYTDQARLDFYSGNLDGDEAVSNRFISLVGGNTPAEDDKPEPKGEFCEVSVKMPLVQFGDQGYYVKLMQTALIAKGFSCGWMGAYGWFGENSKIALYQFSGKVVCDGEVWKKLLEVS